MKTKLLLLLFTIVFTTTNLRAADFTVDGIAYTITSATAPYTVAVIKKSPIYTGAVTIPASVTNSGTTYSVTSIGYRAFNDCTGLTSVTIPNSVTSIGTSAFQSCTGLTSATIPNSVTSIGEYAFNGCTGLTSVTIPNSVTSIAFAVFQNCSSLTSVTIPNSVTSIGGAAFYYCTSLTSVIIGNSVTSIGEWAFAFCGGLTAVTIPNSVTSIGSVAFAFCSGLLYVDTNNPNYSSINGVLYNKDQTALVQCPTSKTGSFDIPLSVTSIGYAAFTSCTGLTSVTIPNSVTSIGGNAFIGCTGLTSVTIPSLVTSIGGNAFYECTGLTTIYANNTTPVDLSSSTNVFFNVNTTTCTLYVPTGSKSLYAAANQWKDFTNIVEHVVTGIATVSISKLNIRVIGRMVEIDLPEASAHVQVVDISGRQLYNGTPSGSTLSVTLPQAGIYLVRVGNKTTKLVVK